MLSKRTNYSTGARSTTRKGCSQAKDIFTKARIGRLKLKKLKKSARNIKDRT